MSGGGLRDNSGSDKIEVVTSRALLQYYRGIKDKLEPWELQTIIRTTAGCNKCKHDG